jgi:hypothetical protein
MENFILAVFICIIFLLNICSFIFFKRSQWRFVLWGLSIMLSSPIIGFLSGSLLFHFQHLEQGETGEGAAYGGAILGFFTCANGFLILLGGSIYVLVLKLRAR